MGNLLQQIRIYKKKNLYVLNIQDQDYYFS